MGTIQSRRQNFPLVKARTFQFKQSRQVFAFKPPKTIIICFSDGKLNELKNQLGLKASMRAGDQVEVTCWRSEGEERKMKKKLLIVLGGGGNG